MPNNLSEYGAAHQTITNMYEQCHSNPTLSPPKCLYWPISKSGNF